MIVQGDALAKLEELAPDQFDCCVTSPPYWNLRDYGIEGQLGLEKTPAEYVDKLVWRVAFALQADGWYLRSDIIWAKLNPTPESIRDRPTKSHEYIFLMASSENYYYDAKAIREPALGETEHDATGQGYNAPGQTKQRGNRVLSGWDTGDGNHHGKAGRYSGRRTREGSNRQQVHPPGITHTLGDGFTKNKRSVWAVNTQACPGAHFATFPEALIEPCVLAGSRLGGVVLDPFAGAGTTGVVAKRLGRGFLGIELNPEYIELAERRIAQVGYQPKLAE